MLILKIIGAVLGAVLAVVILYILFLITCSLFISKKKEYNKDSDFYRTVLTVATAIGLTLIGVKLHITGKEKIPKGQRVLFVSNHISKYDPLVTWWAFHEWRPSFVSKPSNFNVIVFGRIIHRCLFMPIDRENPRNAIKTINRAAELLKSGEVSVAIYPEGTRSYDKTLLPFHNGVFKIAQKAKAPVVVLCVAGTESVHERAPFRRSHIYLDVLEVIEPEQVVSMKTEEIASRVRSEFAENLKKYE